MEENLNIYFVRHGKDDGNYRGGWSDLPLVAEGKEQVKKLAEFLKKNKMYLKLKK